MPQGRDRWIALGIVAAAVLVLAAFALSGGSHSSRGAVSAPAAPSSGKVYTIDVNVSGSGGFAGDIGYIDSAGQYRSQSVAGTISGHWEVQGHSATVTMQKSSESGVLNLGINGEVQSTSAPFGVVTLTAR